MSTGCPDQMVRALRTHWSAKQVQNKLAQRGLKKRFTIPVDIHMDLWIENGSKFKFPTELISRKNDDFWVMRGYIRINKG